MVTPNPLNIPCKVFFWYPLSPLLLSPMCKCDLSLSNVYLTLYVYVYVYVFVLPNCHVFFLLISPLLCCLFVPLFHVPRWLTLAFCCMLVVMSQFEYSQTVNRTMGVPVNKGNVNPLTPNHDSSSFLSLLPSISPSCPKANTAHQSPTSTLCPFHGSAESGVWAASTYEGIQIQSEFKFSHPQII